MKENIAMKQYRAQGRNFFIFWRNLVVISLFRYSKCIYRHLDTTIQSTHALLDHQLSRYRLELPITFG